LYGRKDDRSVSGGLNGPVAAVLGMLLAYLVPVISLKVSFGAVSSVFSSENLAMFSASGPFFFVVAISGGLLGDMPGERLHPMPGPTQN
jgi:hypothetical protein